MAITQKYRIEIIKSNKVKMQPYRWRIVSRNGRVLCHSESYTNKGDVKKVIHNLTTAIIADRVDITEKEE